MRCQQCGTPAMFLAGPDNKIPLCLDCNLKLQTLHTQQLAEMERALNHTVDQMDSIAGFPLGGKFPPRPQPTIEERTASVRCQVLRRAHGARPRILTAPI